MLLLAASHGKPIPPWVVFSGWVPNETTQVAPIRQLTEKIQMVLGDTPRGRAIRELNEHIYLHGATASRLGPKSQRVIPGLIRLMVVPRDALLLALKQDELASLRLQLQR